MRISVKEFEKRFGFTSETKKSKPSKYRAIKTNVDGVVFDSRGEAGRYEQLKLLQRAGHISNLKLQPKFELMVNGILICRYVADFSYVENGKEVVEDFKGFKTPAYNLKKRLMLAIFGIKIFESNNK